MNYIIIIELFEWKQGDQRVVYFFDVPTRPSLLNAAVGRPIVAG